MSSVISAYTAAIIFSGKWQQSLLLILRNFVVVSLLCFALPGIAAQPTIRAITGPSAGSYNSSDSLDFVVSFSENVQVVVGADGPGYLILDLDSGNAYAQYQSVSGADVTFSYTPTRLDFDFNGIELSGFQDFQATNTAGETANLSLGQVSTLPAIKVTHGNAADLPAYDVYLPGDKLSYTLRWGRIAAVSVSGGTPQLPITVGNQQYILNGEATNQGEIVFTHTVTESDLDADGVMLGSLNLNNATIVGTLDEMDDKSFGSHELTVTTSTFTTSGLAKVTKLSDSSSAVLVGRSTVPQVTQVEVPAGGDYQIGDTLSFTVHFDQAVQSLNTADTKLNILLDNERVVQAGYVSAAGAQTSWQFDYVITAKDVAVNGISLLDMSSAGNYLDAGPTYSFSDWRDLVLQNIADSSAITLNSANTPKVMSVTVPEAKTYVAGDTLSFILNYSQDVTVTGSPLLYLTIGEQQVFAQYVSGSGSSALTFNYLLAANLEDFDGIAVDTLALNGGQIESAVAVSADIQLANIGSTANIIVESGAKVSSAQMPVSSTYGYGEKLRFIINFDEVVNVSGQPWLSLFIGEKSRIAKYISGSGSEQLVFEYQVEATDVDLDGINMQRLQTDGAAILNGKQLSADLTLNNIESGAGVLVDGGAPQDYGVSFEQTVIDNSNKTAISFRLNNAPVGTYYNYKLTMANGAPGMISASGVVTQTDQQISNLDLSALADGDILLALSLSYSSASDSASQGQTVTDLITKYTETPVISSVDVPVATFYSKNSTLKFTVNFSAAINLYGSPKLPIIIGGSEVFAGYDSSLSNATSLTFTYLIPSTNSLTDSDGIELGAIDLNGGSISDQLGNAVDLTVNNAGDLTGVIITNDTIFPLTSVASSATGVYQTGDTLTISFSNQYNAPFTVTGMPEIVLALDSGDVTAQYVVPASPSSALTFSYQIQAGDSHSGDALAVKSLSLPSGTTISAFNGAFKFNADVSAINNFTAVNINKSNAAKISSVGSDVVGIYSQGDTFLIQVAFDNVVRVTGTPQLTLDIGGQTAYADYVSGDNSTELTFQYTVQANDNDENGIEFKALALNSGTINDIEANAADLTFSSLQLRNIKIDNSAPFGFSLNIDSAITALTQHDFGFTFLSAEMGATYAVSVTQNSSTILIKTGTITDSGQVIRGLDLSSFADGELVLSVTLTDTLGHVSASLSQPLSKDVVAPQLTSISRYSPTDIATDADTLVWRLTFAEAMQLPDVSNFSLTNSSAALTVTAVAGEPAQFDVTASGGDLPHKIGEVSLNLIAPTAIQDVAGNILSSLVASGEQQGSFTLDNVAWVTIIPPADIVVNATGLLTKISIGQATASDQLDNVYTPERIDNSAYFKPGLNIVNWQVTLPSGQVFTAQQQVKVNPFVAMGQDAQAISGAGYKAKVYLNGQSAAYPMIIPYEMFDQTGDLIESGGIRIASGTEAEIEIEESFTEDYEQVVIKLDASLNLGEKSSFTLTRLDSNSQPELNLTVAQAGEQRYQITNNAEQVAIEAVALNMGINDSYLVDWSTTHSELINISADPSLFQFNPDGLNPGIYKVSATLTKESVIRTQNLYFEVIAEQAVLTTEDSDNDTLADNTEGHTDTDSDGLADYLDNNVNLANVMPHRLADGLRYLLEADLGTRITLGSYSLQDINHGVLLSDELLQKDLIVADGDGENIGGLFDFEIHNLEKSGQSVNVVIPLRASIPENVLLRRYKQDNEWDNFIVDANNKLYSAAGENGYCPEQGDSSYSEGLIAGNWCVRITIEDGGVNDSDGLVNGMVTLLGGVAIYQPKIRSISAISSDGAYKLGDTIELAVKFNNAVAVTGTPELQLETGEIDRTATYLSGNNSDTLLFSYALQASDSSLDLAYLSSTALILNSGSIVSSDTGYSAILTLPAPGAANSLSANSALIVDGIVPVTTDANISIAGGTGASEITIAAPVIELTFDENVVAQSSGDNGISLILMSDSSVVETVHADSAIISANVVTVNFTSTLTPNTQYGVLVGSNAFADTATNLYAGLSASSLRFTTANDAPTAANDIASVDEDSRVQIDALSNDLDSEGYLLASSITVITPPSNGSTSINTANGVITYTPTANFNGSDSFSYQVSDSQGEESNIATVNITVNAVNDIPVLANDSTSTDEDTAVTIDVLANDTDVDTGDVVGNVVIVSAPTNGSISIVNGKVSYQPSSNYFGSDSFTYQAQDSTGAPGVAATVIVNISGDNDIPVANGDSATTSEDTAVTIGVLANDTDIENEIDVTSVTVMASPTKGSVSINGITGEITYTPNADANGSDSFSYVVKDNEDATSNEGIVNVTITAVNDAPVVNDDSVANVQEDTVYPINVLGNDTDVENNIDITSVAIITQPTQGSVTVNAVTGAINYTPGLNYFGDDSFAYTVKDADNAVSNTAIVTLTIASVNDIPVANDDSYVVNEDSEDNNFTLLVNDSDIDGILDDTSIVIGQTANHGVITVNVDGSVDYTPNANYVGDDSFTYTVKDNEDGETNSATVIITVANVNDAPVITLASALTVAEDGRKTLSFSYADVDSESVTAVVKTQAAHGLVSVVGTDISYLPTDNYNGSDSFTLTLTDSDGFSVDKTINVTVNMLNDAPIAQDDQFSLAQNDTNQYVLSVLDNDSDIDGDQLAIIGASAAIGEVMVENNQLIYHAVQGFVGNVDLRYAVVDGLQSIDTASVYLTITGVPAEIAPEIIQPNDVEVNASGLFTKVDIGVATATDYLGNPIAVSLVDGNTMFAPGTHDIYWQAIDRYGNKTIATQKILVHPLVSISKDQTVVEGNKVEVKIILNGNSPSYPVVVPFTVSGSAIAGEDHELFAGEVTIDSSNEAQLSFNVLIDNKIEEPETIQITLSDTINRSKQDTQIITIREGNLAPEVELLVEQGGEQRFLLSQNGGEVNISAKMSDANELDAHRYQWASSNDALQILLGSHDAASMSISAEALAEGVYPISVTVTDNGEPVKATRAEVYLEVTAVLPVLTEADSDGDLIPDDQEGYGDQDSDGIPDYQDAITACNVAPEEVTQQQSFLVEGEAGVCLRKGASSAGNASGGSLLNEQELANSIGNDTEAINVGGIFDYIAYGLPQVGQEYRIVLPQRLPIPANAVYRKYSQTAGWMEYVEDAGNALFSSPGKRGYCPPPQDKTWRTGLNEGDWCVQLMLNDGGPNDNDGLANGTIVDPGGVSVYRSGNNMPVAQNATQTVLWNSTFVIDVMKMVSDEDGDDLTISNASADFGEVSIIDGRQISYQPATDFVGTDHLVYSISDGNGGTASGTVSVTVLANSVPVAVDDSASTDDRTSILVDVLANDSDADNNRLTLISVSAALGAASIIDNKLSYTPPIGSDGVDTISYTLSDGKGGSASAILTVSVKAYRNVVVDNKSGSGGAVSMWILLLIPLAIFRKKINLVALLLLVNLLSLPAKADWGMAVKYGQTTADVSQGEFNQQLANLNADAQVTSLDDKSAGWGIDAIYRFDEGSLEHWQLILGYQDLGTFDVTVSGQAIEPEQFLQLVSEVRPQSADGWTASVAYQFMLSERFFVQGQLGLFNWQSKSDSQLHSDIFSATNVNHSGHDLFYGGELGYKLLENVEASISYNHYSLDKNAVEYLGIGVKYFY